MGLLENKFYNVKKDLEKFNQKEFIHYFYGTNKEIQRTRKFKTQKDNLSCIKEYGNLNSKYLFLDVKEGQIEYGELRVKETNKFLLYFKEKSKKNKESIIKLITNDSKLVNEVLLDWEYTFLDNFMINLMVEDLPSKLL